MHLVTEYSAATFPAARSHEIWLPACVISSLLVPALGADHYCDNASRRGRKSGAWALRVHRIAALVFSCQLPVSAVFAIFSCWCRIPSLEYRY
jgi:hypothetical protein